jgi:hypothetical protein
MLKMTGATAKSLVHGWAKALIIYQAIIQPLMRRLTVPERYRTRRDMKILIR